MQEQTAFLKLVQRCPESAEQFPGQVPDKPDGVRNDGFRIPRKPQPRAFRVERGKQFVFRQDGALRQALLRGLARVGVADNGNYRKA